MKNRERDVDELEEINMEGWGTFDDAGGEMTTTTRRGNDSFFFCF